MKLIRTLRLTRLRWRCASALVRWRMLQMSIGPRIGRRGVESAATGDNTHSPIKHVIVIIGENRSFDHVFATYVPQHGQSVWNLLSEGIVKRGRHSRPEFRQGAAARRVGSGTGRVPAEPAEDAVSRQRAAGAAGRRPQADSYITGDSLTLARAVGERPAAGLLSVSGLRRHAARAAKLPTRASPNVNSLPPVRSS